MISVREYLNRKRFQWREQRGQAVMNCPFCQDKEQKFAIGLNNGAFNCYHLNTCGVKGSFVEFQKLLGDEPETIYGQKQAFYRQTKKQYKLPTAKITAPSNPVISYLIKSRGFTADTIKHFGIGASGTAVMLPYYRNNVLVNIKYRDINDKKKMWTEKEAEPILFNRDNIYDETLVICEGEYDAMALFQYGIDAVSVPMGAKNFEWVDNEWDYLEEFKAIYLCFDNDRAGIEAVRDLVQKLGAWRCKGVVLPFKDANECLIKGVAKDTVKAAFDRAFEFTPTMLASPSQFTEEIKESFVNPDAANGTPTPWVRLNEILKGWRNEELTVWSGRNSAGKSTILNQVIIDLAQKNTKSCIASLEMPAKRYLRWAVIQYLENYHPAPIAIEGALRWFDDKIYLVNTVEEAEPKELLEVFEYAARRYDVKHFIVDSLMRVKFPNRDELNEQKSFVNSLLSFAKKFNCHVHLVAHPRKALKDGERPGKVDVKGTGDITNLAHNVLIVWRPEEEDKDNAKKKGKDVPDAVLFVKKNREFGVEGGIRMKFNPVTKRFADYSEA